MALIKNGVVSYAGAVIDIWDHCWADGMVEETALVWELEKHEYKTVQIGYYAADGHDFVGTKAEVEVSVEVARDILRTMKTRALQSFCRK